MAHIGELSLAAISGSQKLALSMVSLNLDFSLIKFDAPKEYEDVGKCLSTKRKKEAEDGYFHVITRKLEVLFVQDDLPKVPYLLQAYGKRTSEISKNRKFNPKGSAEHGAFAPHIGADGTGIWAAATSGKGAITVHLLACMLAYIFKGPEAISVWTELVSIRQRTLRKQVEGAEYTIPEITASQIKLDRKDLAIWDTSARSWLQTADAAHYHQQSQLKLIAQSIERSLSSGPDIYTCVKSAWHKAMIALDKIVQGMPHDVQDPEVMLGLLAWHIYPDMNVVTGVTKLIEQNDPLVAPGGIITLGLQSTPTLGDRGITWSLPLSHLRYYGNAVISTGCIEEASSRVPFLSLLFVTLGCVTRGWRRKGEDMEDLSKFFLVISNFLHEDPKTLQPHPRRWIKLLGHAAKRYLNTSGPERVDADRLIAWGRRRATTFLGESTEHLPRLFNLSDRWTFTKTLKVFQKYSDSEQKIAWLRQNLTQDIVKNLSIEDALILYPRDPWKTFHLSPEEKLEYDMHNHKNHPDCQLREGTIDVEFASLVPRVVESGRETSKVHRRWICASEQNGEVRERKGKILDHMFGYEKKGYEIIYEAWTIPGKAAVLTDAALSVIRNSDTSETYSLYRATSFSKDSSKGTISLAERDFKRNNIPLIPERGPSTVATDDGIHFPPCQSLERPEYRGSLGCPNKWYIDELRTAPELCDWFPWFGNDDDVAVYSKRDGLFGSTTFTEAFSYEKLNPLPELQELTIDEILQAIKSNEVDRNMLTSHLFESTVGDGSVSWVSQYHEQLAAVTALYTAFKLYEGFSDALVDLRVTSQPLSKAHWVQEKPSDAKAFACIAMFELGTADINPLDLLGVTALSSGNSLYIAEYLLRDPFEVPKRAVITRTVGNIGRPGLNFLISPKSLDVKKPDYSSWRQINHADFDGKIERNFEETSFHLRFTGYESALNVRDHGLYDKEVFVLQAVIQAFDKGSWVADLDLVGCMTGDTEQRMCTRIEDCDHGDMNMSCDSFDPITSVDSWDELLDAPDNAYVVRAGGNWIARLAIAAVLAQQLKPFYLTSSNICWRCIEQHARSAKGKCIVVC